MPDLIAALRPGLPHEPVGLLLVERVETLEGDFDKASGVWPSTVRYVVRHIGRLANGSRYSEIGDLVAEVLGDAKATRLSFLVDISTAGRTILSVVERHRPIPVVVSGETALPKVADRAIKTPLTELVGALTVVIGERRLSADPKLEHADLLGRQLAEFRAAKVPGDRPEPAEFATCAMLCTWWGDTRLRSLLKQPPPPREMPEPPRPPTFNELLKLSKVRRGMKRRI